MTTLTTSGQPGSDTSPTPTRVKRGRTDLRTALIFLIPATIGFVMFYLVPAIRGVYFSFTNYPVLAPAEWVGLANYERLINDPLFWNAMGVTAIYVLINITVQTLLAILIAILMQRMTRSIAIRGALLLPYFIANVIVALVWYFMLDFQLGVVNVALGWFGIDPQAFFGDAALALPTIALINVWRHMGYTAPRGCSTTRRCSPRPATRPRTCGRWSGTRSTAAASRRSWPG